MRDDGELDLRTAPEPPRARRPAARRRPGMVALLYVYRALASLLIAAPIAASMTSLVGDYPRGDAALFDPGGVMLVEAGRLARPLFAPFALQGGLLAVVVSLAGLLPLAALIAALGREGPLAARFLVERAASSFSALILLGGSALLAQAALAALIVLLGQKGVELARLGVRDADIARAAVAAVSLAAVLALGVVHDLARVSVVHEGRRFYAASVRALRAATSAWRRVAWAYSWRGALALAAVLAAAWAGQRLGAGSAARFALSAASHQAAIALAVFLRASWLAAAIGVLSADTAPASPVDPAPPPVAPSDAPPAPASSAEIRLEPANEGPEERRDG